MNPWSLVTPASRGIGLQVARQLLQTTSVPVVATARSDLDRTKESILTGLDKVDESRLKVLKLDVVDEDSISTAASECKALFPSSSHYLHLAMCLPGILYPEKSPTQISYDDALVTLRTNTLGPMMLMKHFSPFLPRKSTSLSSPSGLAEQATFAILSARVGSISDNSLGGWYSYRASKTGVNQLARTFDLHLRTSAGDKATAIALHPGTVKTGLSEEFWSKVKKEKLFEPEYAAERLLDVVKQRGLEGRGRCWDWKGEEIKP